MSESQEAPPTPDTPEATATSNLLYGIDDIPPARVGWILGLQHYLTMFGSTVAIPLFVASQIGIDASTPEGKVSLATLIATMFFVSGITTLLQSTWGNRLPIIQGGTFSFFGPTIAICSTAALANAGWEVRMQHLQGAIIAGSFFEIFFGVTGIVGRLRRLVGPITIAPTIALIGLSLFKFGAPKAGEHWLIGGATIVLIILCSQYLRTTHKLFEMFPILIAIVGAWLLAYIGTAMGSFPAGHPSHVDFSGVQAAPWIRVPYPFQWGAPQFGTVAAIGMLSGYLASVIESVGDYYACARLAGAPVPTAKTINRGITFEGIGCLIAGIFGTGNGTTSYSENIGAIGLTRVASRRVVQLAAILMIGLGVIAKFGALFTSIPSPVVGGMYCAMFGMITAVGLSNLQFVDLNSARNLFIIGFAFFMGLSLPEYFGSNPIKLGADVWNAGLADVLNTIGTNGMATAGLCAFLLDNTVPGTDEERGLVAWMASE
jgi:uracil-xanthine permease